MATVEELQKQVELLSKALEKAEKRNDELMIQNDELSKKVYWYEEQLRLAAARKYKGTSENGNKFLEIPLFDETELIQAAYPEAPTEETAVNGHKRKKKQKADLSKLPLKVVHHDINGGICPDCGARMKEVASTIKEVVIKQPARFYVERHIIHNYVCEECSDDEHAVFRSGENYKKLIDKSLASESLVAEIITKKFTMGLPLYRIEQEFMRKKLPFTRQNMSSWLTICTENYLNHIFDLMQTDLLKEDILYGDETTLNCLEQKDKEKSYMWIQRTSPFSDKQIALYHYREGRDYDYAKELYSGFSGYLHADGYGAYRDLENTVIVGCWAHARRKVVEAMEASPVNSRILKTRDKQLIPELLDENPSYARIYELFLMVEELYARDKKILKKTDDFEEIKRLRLEEEKPVIDRIEKWLGNNGNTFLPQSKSGKAVQYFINVWTSLSNYLKDGRLEMTNNLGERTVKPFVIGRKNWLFANTERGAHVSAALYSIVETAKANKLDPETYLEYVLGKLKMIEDPFSSEEEIRKLLPYSPEIKEYFSH